MICFKFLILTSYVLDYHFWTPVISLLYWEFWIVELNYLWGIIWALLGKTADIKFIFYLSCLKTSAYMIEEELKEQLRKKQEALKHFQRQVKHRVNQQIRLRKKQQLQKSYEAVSSKWDWVRSE